MERKNVKLNQRVEIGYPRTTRHPFSSAPEGPRAILSDGRPTQWTINHTGQDSQRSISGASKITPIHTQLRKSQAIDHHQLPLIEIYQV